MQRAIKDRLKRWGFYLFRLGSRFGFHVVPVHYYSPLPDLLELERTTDVWARKSDLPGLAFDAREQGLRLREICLPFQQEYLGNSAYHKAVSQRYGPGFGFIEAQALHAFIRHARPRRILEVGSGVSTFCMLQALGKNREEGQPPCRLTCIEPYPSGRLQDLPGIELLRQKVQTVPWRVFEELRDGDFLFIDSAHAEKPGSDVNFLILEVLPRLRPGVYVHFHDVYFPYDYPRDVLHNFFAATETSLLRAFLTHNRQVRTVVCMSFLHYEAPEVFLEVFPEYDRQPDVDGLTWKTCKPCEPARGHFPSSLYLQTTA